MSNEHYESYPSSVKQLSGVLPYNGNGGWWLVDDFFTILFCKCLFDNRHSDELIPHIFNFLMLLSYERYHTKTIVQIPKIIQLCDGIMASGQDPVTHGIRLYVVFLLLSVLICGITFSNRQLISYSVADCNGRSTRQITSTVGILLQFKTL